MKKKRLSSNTLREVVRRLIEHPNGDSGNVRYLQSVEYAADILEHARGLDGFGERAFGLAQQLRQFHVRLDDALHTPNASGEGRPHAAGKDDGHEQQT